MNKIEVTINGERVLTDGNGFRPDLYFHPDTAEQFRLAVASILAVKGDDEGARFRPINGVTGWLSRELEISGAPSFDRVNLTVFTPTGMDNDEAETIIREVREALATEQKEAQP